MGVEVALRFPANTDKFSLLTMFFLPYSQHCRTREAKEAIPEARCVSRHHRQGQHSSNSDL